MVLRNTIKRRRRVISSKRRKIKIKSRKTRGSRKIIMKGGVKVNDQEVKSFQCTYNDDGSINDGKGTMTYENGDVYDGLWMNSVKNGVGVMTYANGDVYAGNWKDDKKNGKGTLTYNELEGMHIEGIWVEGIWENDQLVNGTQVDENPDNPEKSYTYRGTFREGKPNGKGTITTKKYNYVGEISEGNPNGIGIQIFNEREDNSVIRYDGTWKDGTKQTGTLMILKRMENGSNKLTEINYVDGVKGTPVVSILTASR